MNHSAFELVTTKHIDSLNIEVEHYRHKVTGAEHFHLAADDAQNVFMVALRTVPMDSSGVAHILEHTTLCGSEKYPVRDPFFMMIRRSLNTFMNAFTSSDWTAYPFATENRKDFQNLLQVYMDAVFFPNLNELDFIQEGHRFEFEEMQNPDSELVYKGVVFNEMKGAMSSPVSTLWQAFSSELYPTSTYHYNSGGEPEDIPDLTYQQLVDFHQYHYHPSNAVFMTYGDISAQEHQQQFEALALARFNDKVDVVKVSAEHRYDAPRTASAPYALNEPSMENKTHIVVGWLLGENKEPADVLKGHLLSSILLDNSASPLRHALEIFEKAEAPSPLCGFEDSNKEMAFVAGVQGSEKSELEAVEQAILDCLQSIAKDGVEAEMVESALHQLELSQREIGGDGYPYGLQLMLQSLAGAMHDGDPIALLDTDEALKQLRKEAENPRFVAELVQTWLLDNPHRVAFTLVPEKDLAEQKEQAEKEKLALIKSQLTAEQKQAIIKQALDLEARQAQEDDVSLLPEVTKEDVPADIKQVEGSKETLNNLEVASYQVGTNGLVYEQLIMQMPDLTPEEQNLMPFFSMCLPELGSGGRDYLQTQALQSAVTGGIGAKSSLRSNLDDNQSYMANFVVSGKALNRNQQALASLIQQTLAEVSFSELDRIKDLVAQIRASVDQSVTGNGHGLAMLAASQNFSPLASWSFNRSGFAGIQTIKDVYDDLMQDDSALENFAQKLSGIQQKMLAASKQALVISDEAGLSAALEGVNAEWKGFKSEQNLPGLALNASLQPVKQAWTANTQVNFCAMSYPAVSSGHDDAPKLSVLSACLRNGFLHSAVREKGGAYGGGAAFNAESGAFQFYSYRDPRLMETYEDFDRAFEWLLSGDASQAKVDEAILNVISSMDKPGSPAGEARKAFYQDLYGRSYESRMRYRQGVLETTLQDLRDVAAKYLLKDKASYAVLTNESNQSVLVDHGFDMFKV